MARLQELIHALEVGAGVRYLRTAALLLGILAIAILYDFREFQNFRHPEAMDAAQVARNVAEGRGFTTRYIRPLSMALIMEHRSDRDPLLREEHPDLANAPLYPLVLAGFMKIPGLFDYTIESGREAVLRRHQPEFVITLINQMFFFLALLLVWRLARRLFDSRVALITVLVLLGSDLLWSFSSSGLPTMLALLLATVLANLLHDLDAGSLREKPRGTGATVALAAFAGVVCALLAMTRYSLGALIVPVLIYLAAAFPRRRVLLPLAAGVCFLAACSPWLIRNGQLCGNPFGVAGYDLFKETSHFTGDWLDRSLDPDVSRVSAEDLGRKVFVGAADLLQEDLPRLGGSWVAAFFLVGLFVPFVHRLRSRLRWFTVGALVALAVAQVLSRTHRSEEGLLHAENLVVILSPLALMFGSALLVQLIDSVEFPTQAWRRYVAGGAVLVFALPLLVRLGPPRNFPIAYPPYYPPTIERVAHWFEPDELIMTDMPWAVAWYGDRQAIQLTHTPEQEFLDISDWQKPIRGLYLTRLTLDQRFVADWVLNGREWGKFIIDILTVQRVPTGYPLRKSVEVKLTLPDFLLLADRERWIEYRPITPPRRLQAPHEDEEDPPPAPRRARNP